MKVHIVDSDRFIADLNKKRDTAWYKLYEEFYPALCAYAERLTGGNAGVEDIVQECMVALWDTDLHFPNIQALASWLYKAVYNRVLNLIRERDTARRLLGHYISEISYSEEMAVEMAVEETIVAKLRLVLSELSGQQQQIMNKSLQGLKVKEIADQLGVSENTVKMQKKRAYSCIREQMGGIWSGLVLYLFAEYF